MCNNCNSVLVPENKGDFQSTLLKYIDAEELPAFLGGKKTDPDGNPRCETIVFFLFPFWDSNPVTPRRKLSIMPSPPSQELVI